MTRSRKSKPSNLAIAMAIIIALLLALGAYTNFFGIVQPGPDFTTWPKVHGVWVGEAYIRSWQLGFVKEYKIATVNYYYRPIVWDHQYRKWREMNPPASVPITYYPSEIMKAVSATGTTIPGNPFSWLLDLGLNPNTVQSKDYARPGTWEYEEQESWLEGVNYVKFRLDPDKSDDLLPDIAVYVKPLVDKPHPNGKWRWASYEVTVAIIGDSPREITTYYKNTHADILFDMYYLVREVRVNGEALGPDEVWQDEQGRIKIQILAPSKAPKEEPGDVTAIAYIFNFAPVTGEKQLSYCTYRIDIIYDPKVVVATASSTVTMPVYPTPTTTGHATGTLPPPVTETVTVTELMPVTRTRTVTEKVEITVEEEGQVVTKTLTETHTVTQTGYVMTEKTHMVTGGTTITKVVTKKVGGGVDECLFYNPWNQTQCLIPRCLIEDKEGKCVLPAIYAIIGAFLAIYLGTVAGFSIAARKGRRSRRRR